MSLKSSYSWSRRQGESGCLSPNFSLGKEDKFCCVLFHFTTWLTDQLVFMDCSALLWTEHIVNVFLKVHPYVFLFHHKWYSWYFSDNFVIWRYDLFNSPDDWRIRHAMSRQQLELFSVQLSNVEKFIIKRGKTANTPSSHWYIVFWVSKGHDSRNSLFCSR